MNKKRLIAAIASVAVIATILAGFGKKAESQEQISVGMITDSGNIDDKSYNQSAWEGVERAAKDFSLNKEYLKPSEKTEAAYNKAIDTLVNGFNLIVTPGPQFETTIFKAQEKYKQIKFVLLDGVPTENEGTVEKSKVADNTVSVLFAEQDAGFLAGVATAVQLKEGELGFIGGMEIPPVQRFNWGFQQGVKYANEKLGTNMIINPRNVVYQGSFNNVAAGEQLAARMFNRGVKAIFTAAGLVGIGAVNEAKIMAGLDKEAWIVGVDKDQYDIGLYPGNKSVILTSAIKNIEKATYDMIKDAVEGRFQGGKIVVYDVKNDGVGLPKENPNLSPDTIKKIEEVYQKMKSGDIKVSSEKDDLIK